MRLLGILLAIVILAGCMTVRTYTIEKPRVDTDIQGNRGFISGAPDQEAVENRLGDTRTISVVEVEFRKPNSRKKDSAKEETIVDQEVPTEEMSEDLDLEEEYVQESTSTEEYKLYTVQKNDTLQKISYKFYGTTRKWKMIYNKNKDVIKNSDRLYPGVTIKIPVLD